MLRCVRYLSCFMSVTDVLGPSTKSPPSIPSTRVRWSGSDPSVYLSRASHSSSFVQTLSVFTDLFKHDSQPIFWTLHFLQGHLISPTWLHHHLTTLHCQNKADAVLIYNFISLPPGPRLSNFLRKYSDRPPDLRYQPTLQGAIQRNLHVRAAPAHRHKVITT